MPPRKKVTAVEDPDDGIRYAHVRALKSFNDWPEHEVRWVPIDPLIAHLIVIGYLEEWPHGSP